MFQQADNYGSAISTRNPFSQSDVRRSAAITPAYSGPNQTRNAFARALVDRSRSDTRDTFSEAGREFRQKAEESRARDVASQRQSKLERYGLGSEKKLEFRRQDARRTTTMADLASDMEIARQNYRVNRARSFANMGLAVGSLLVPGRDPITRMYQAAAFANGSPGAAQAVGSPSLSDPILTGRDGFGNMGVVSGLNRR